MPMDVDGPDHVNRSCMQPDGKTALGNVNRLYLDALRPGTLPLISCLESGCRVLIPMSSIDAGPASDEVRTTLQGGVMPENVRRQKWLTVSFFLVCGLIFAVFVYVISSGTVDRSYQNWMAGTRNTPKVDSSTAGIADNHTVIALRNRPVDLGNILLTYRGISSGMLELDIVILDLDPQYVYHRRIPVEAADKGLEIGSRRFKLLSINHQRLILIPVEPSI